MEEKLELTRRDGKYFFLDGNGNPTFGKSFDYAENFHNGYALVRRFNLLTRLEKYCCRDKEFLGYILVFFFVLMLPVILIGSVVDMEYGSWFEKLIGTILFFAYVFGFMQINKNRKEYNLIDKTGDFVFEGFKMSEKDVKKFLYKS